MRFTARIGLAFTLLAALAACSDPNTVTLDDFYTRNVTLPGGVVIHAEVASTQAQVEKGLMFRKSMAADHGMLFIFSQEERLTFWMYHTLIPLDIIWMDAGKHVVEISANTPPCKAERSEQCPVYGGAEGALFVLELPGGSAARYHLKKGDTIQF